jgi:2-polyprenyl-3-methyl-5-hydroxy-6-metoxy-1,4-benzoquinol methylase
MYEKAVHQNHKNIINLFETNTNACLLDLGCDDGIITKKIAHKINTNNIYGVEIVDERIAMAIEKDIRVTKFDLNNEFEFPSNFFDVIHANQVIEHLHSSDSFLSEIFRVLKKDSYAIISTENASSWCNIGASLLGWQIFSLTNFSKNALGVGNPMALHRNQTQSMNSWLHVRIYNIRGLKEYFELYGFEVEKITGAGYFPLPSFLSNFDTTHSHFITFKVRKK